MKEKGKSMLKKNEKKKKKKKKKKKEEEVKLLSWWAELAEISVHEDEEEFSFGLTKLW